MFALADDQTADGADIVQAMKDLEQAGADIVGLNCGRGPETMLPLLKKIKTACKVIILVPLSTYNTVLEYKTITIVIIIITIIIIITRLSGSDSVDPFFLLLILLLLLLDFYLLLLFFVVVVVLLLLLLLSNLSSIFFFFFFFCRAP